MKEENTNNEMQLENNLNGGEINHKERNKKGKVKFLIIGFLVIIAIAIGLFVGYKKLNNDPMGIYKDSINSVYKTLSDALKENKKNSLDNFDIRKDPFVIDLKAKLTSDMPELKNFTGLNYHLNTGMDLANKKMNIGLDIEDNNTFLLNALVAVLDKNVYLKIFDKVLDLGEEDVFGNMDIDSYFKVNGADAKFDYDNYNYILKEMKDIIINSLAKDKFKMEDATITINNKEYKGKKAIYNLDKENMERTLKYIKDSILKDDKLIKALAESTGITTEELKESLREDIDMTGYTNSEINLYTDKFNELIAGSIVTNEEEIIKFDCVNNEINFTLEADNQVLKVIKDKNDKIVITFTEDNNQLFKITFEGNDKEFKMPFTFNIEGAIISGTVELKNIKVTNDSISADLIFSLNTSIANKKIDFAIDGSYSLKKTELDNIDTTNSIKIDNLSEEEAMEIFNKLNTLIERFGLEDLVGSMM